MLEARVTLPPPKSLFEAIARHSRTRTLDFTTDPNKVMETVYLPMMTRWQFYAMFGVQFVLGVAYCLAMFWCATRDPVLEWKPSPLVDKLQNKVGFGLFIVAAVTSYFSLPDVFYAFVEDASSGASEVIVETATEVLDGTYRAPGGRALQEYLSGVIGGQPNDTQHTALLLMAVFWISLGWCAYTLDFKPSPVGVWKKLVKPVGYAALTALMCLVPMCLHRFSWAELQLPLLLSVVAGACIAASHTYNRVQPPPVH